MNSKMYREPTLSLYECIVLDAIQKQKEINKEIVSHLKKKGYVEGRYPNLFISEHIAKSKKQMNYGTI